MMFRLTTIVALVGFVSASSFSIGCMNTLMAIGNDPAISGCLAPNLLLPVLVGAGNGPESVVPHIDTWLNGMCAQPACTDGALDALINTLTTGCSAEFGIPKNQATLTMVKQGYTTFRKVVCLKDGPTLCVTETLQNMESAWGTMTLNDKNIASIVNGFKKGLPSNVLCTNCMKGAYSIINQDIPGTFSESDAAYATKTCGAAFTDGGIPPSLVQTGYDPNYSAPPVVSSTFTQPTSTSTSTSSFSVTSSTSTATSSSVRPSATTPPRRNGSVGGPSATPLMNIAVSGLVIVFTGMTLL